MNKTYSKVWSKALGQLVVASELTRKSGPAGSGKGRSAALPFALFSIVTVGSGVFESAPVGADVVTQTGVACGASGTTGTGPDGVTTYTDRAQVDGNGYYSLVGGCSASGGGSLVGVTVYGAFATATGNGAVATGFGAQAAKWSSAYGLQANASGQSSVAMGFNAKASATGATAIGANNTSGANAAAADAIALGGQSSVVAAATSGIAIGRGATVNGAFGIAQGDGVISGATGQNVAIGSSGTTANSATTAGAAVAIGRGQKATGDGAVAIGDPNVVNGTGAVAMGANNTAAGDPTGAVAANGAVAIGNGNTAIGQGAVALGNASKASAAGAIALGDGATATNARDVALGSGAVTAAPHTGVTGVYGGTASGVALPASGVVSVGAAGAERQIQNVAAGVISATSTDAVNGSQLNTVVTGVNNLGTSMAASLGGGAIYSATTGNVTGFSQALNNVGASGAVGAAAAQTTVAGALSALNTSIGNTANVAVKYDVAGGNKITLGATGGAGAPAGGVTITNLAAGVNSTDAVNVGQLNSTVAASKTQYFSVNSTGAGNQANNGATGIDAIAIGVNAQAAAQSGVAIGSGASIADTNGFAGGVAIGNGASGVATAVSVGEGSRATFKDSTTVGSAASSLAQGASAFGGGTNASATNSVALGHLATVVSAGTSGIALGNGATVNGAFGIAQGDGVISGATGQNVAIGSTGTTANSATAAGAAVAIGRGQRATGDGAVAIGDPNVVNGTGAVAMGANNTAAGDPTGAVAANGAVAIGNGNTAIGQGAVALGNASKASAAGAIALGDGATATNARDVALGSGAVTAAPHTGVTGVYGGTASGVALPASGVVSVGAAGAERQIQNVAAGVISATSTDAVNGSQLNTVVTGVNNLGTSIAASLGGGATYSATTGNISGFSQALNNVGASGAVGTAAAQTTVAGALSALNTSLGNTANIAVKYDSIGSNKITLGATGGAGALAGGVTITNLAPGAISATSTDAVNGSQLNTTNLQVTGINTRLTTAEGTIAGHTTQITALKTDALQWNATAGAYDASHGTGTAQKISNVAAGTAATDAVNVTQLNTVSTAVANASDRAVNYDGAVGSAKDTITLAGTAGTKITNLTAGNVSATSTDAVNGSQLNTTNQQVAGIDTRVTTTEGNIATNTTQITALQTDALQWNPTLGAYDASHGSGTAQKISNVAAGTAGTDAVNVTQLDAVSTAVGNASDRAVTYDGAVGSAKDTITLAGTAGTKITNLTAGDVSATSTDAVNGSQLNTTNQQVAGIDTRVTTAEGNITAAQGTIATHTTQITALQTDALQWNPTLGAYDASHGTANPQKISNVAAGTAGTDAVNVTQLDAVSTAVGATSDRAVTYDGAVGSAKDTITLAGAAGTKITNVAPGAVSATSTDAVNGSQLNTTNQQVAGIDTRVTTAEGDIAGNTTQITALQTDALQWNPTLGAYDASHGTGTAQKISNVAAGTANTDAVNLGQLNAVSTAVGNASDRAVTYDGAVGSAKDSITLAGTAGTKITNLTAGDVSATSTDAVNGSQLNTTNQQVAGIDTRVTTAEGNITAAQGTIATHTTQITALQTDALQWNPTLGAYDASHGTANSQKISNVAAGTAGTDAVNVTQLDAVSTAVGATSDRAVTYDGAVGSAKDTITLAGAAGTKITNVAPGTVSATSTDAVNGSQLNTTNQQVAGIDTRVTTAEGNIASNTTQITALQTDALQWNPTLGAYDASHGTANPQRISNVAAGTAGTDAVNVTQLDAVSTAIGNASDRAVTYDGAVGSAKDTITLAGAAGTKITNVAPGTVSATSTDAVNGAQLNTTNQQVASIDTRVTTAEGTIAGHTTEITALQTDALQWNPTLGAYDASHGAGTAQKISNVAAGTAGTDAVNVTQLDAVSTAIGNASDRAVTYDGAVGSAKDTITLAGAAGTKITNVAPGAVSATSTDAVNGAQLFTANQAIGTIGSTVTNLGNSVASGLGGGTTYDPTTGAITTSLTYGGNSYGSVQDVFNQISGVVDGGGIKYFHASSNLADSVASGLNSVAVGPAATASAENAVSMGNGATASVLGGVALGSGAVSDRAIAPSSGSITIGTNLIPFNTTDRTLQGAVSVGNATDFRQITNVADGTEDQDAVTLRQLKGAMGSFSVTPIQYFHTNSTAADSLAVGAESVAIGPQTTVNGDNGIGIGNQAIVAQTAPGGTAIGQNATVNLADGVALGTNATSNGIQAMALGTGSQAAFAGSVALGAGSSTDAAVATTGITLNGTNYAFAGSTPGSTVSVGSAGSERTITNLAAGRISATSTDAVNGSELYATNQTVALLNSQITNLSNTVNNFPTTTGGGSTNNTVGSSPDNTTPASATGTNSTAVGAGAVASGNSSTAVGAGSTASGQNSVALGAGSVADGANTVSVGSPGHERTITNVANGVNATDAANVGQVNQALQTAKDWSKDYVDQRIQGVNQDLDRVSNRANAGIASAMAMAGLGQAYQANQSSLGMALGSFHGESGIAVGLSTVTESGHFIVKVNGTTNSRGDTGASVGATMVW